jgi:hypothetical protein
MMEVIAAIIYAAAVLAFAEQCAKWDAEEIAYRIRNNGESLDHAPMWRFRAAIVAGAALGLWWFLDIPLLPLLGFGAFAFSAWFRLRLNKRRGKDWRYVSASNHYDRAFLFVSHVLPGAHESDEWVHRAGTIAYYCELTITAACILWVALTL